MGGSASFFCLRSKTQHSTNHRRLIEIMKNRYTININDASEDEFLLLPGITRILAQNIINYRQEHGNFKHVKQLLLVEGFEKSLLRRIRTEVSIGEFQNPINPGIVNINTADYEQLCSLPGFTSTLAKRIIRRRERKGEFRFIEDLLKIRGMNYIILAGVRAFIVVNQTRSVIEDSINDQSSIYRPGISKTLDNDSICFISSFLQNLPQDLCTRLVSSSKELSLQVLPPLDRCLRSICWNLQNLTVDKITNPGVRLIICQIILSYHFQLVAIQEIDCKEALEILIDELNEPTFPKLQTLCFDRKRTWKYFLCDEKHASTNLAIIYDNSIIEPIPMDVSIPLFIDIFVFNQYRIRLVNLQLYFKPAESHDAMKWENIIRILHENIDQQYVILFGHFDCPTNALEFEPLRTLGMVAIEGNNQIIQTINSTGYSHIWLSPKTKELNTDNFGTISKNLSHLLIPDGWNVGGMVSVHYPVWNELQFV